MANKTVLVVEDDVSSLNSLTSALRKTGYDVQPCKNYHAACDRLMPMHTPLEPEYAAIISDFNLGHGSRTNTGINVWQFANRALKSMPPFIAMSSEMKYWQDFAKAIDGENIHLVPKAHGYPDEPALLAKLKELNL